MGTRKPPLIDTTPWEDKLVTYPAPVRLKQIAVNETGLYALDSEGRLWLNMDGRTWISVPVPVTNVEPF